jgi:ribosomal protein S6
MKFMLDTENNSQIKDENKILEDGDARVYELGYLLVPTIPGEEVPAIYGNLKELVASFGGVQISDEMPKMIPLAYTMRKVTSNIRSKWNTAYFGWMKFTMDTIKILELKKKLDLDPNVIRFLILKTVKENTIAVKRFVRSTSMYHKTPSVKKDNEVAVPIDKEEIDKEIDALVAV